MGSRFTIGLCIAALLCGCLSNPYVKREVENEAGETVEVVFAYGKYCGPGNPVLFEDSEDGGTVTDLFVHWPPVDDIDAACFAHDYCYQDMHPRTNQCDVAMSELLLDVMKDFPDPACLNLAHDLWAVIEATQSERPKWDLSQRVEQAAAAAAGRLILEVRSTTDRFPDEGDCLLVPNENGTLMLDAFEHYFSTNQELFRKPRQLIIPRKTP